MKRETGKKIKSQKVKLPRITDKPQNWKPMEEIVATHLGKEEISG